MEQDRFKSKVIFTAIVLEGLPVSKLYCLVMYELFSMLIRCGILGAKLKRKCKIIKARREREKRERERAERLQHLQYVHDHQEQYCFQINQAVEHTVGARYDDAVRDLVELREAANHFNETREFHERFRTWVQSYRRRPGLLDRLRRQQFIVP